RRLLRIAPVGGRVEQDAALAVVDASPVGHGRSGARGAGDQQDRGSGDGGLERAHRLAPLAWTGTETDGGAAPPWPAAPLASPPAGRSGRRPVPSIRPASAG